MSNNIAEGFERATTAELSAFLAIARGSAGEVRSMLAVVGHRPGLASLHERLGGIRALADACVRQLTAWMTSIEDSPIQGKRLLTGDQRKRREMAEKAQEFRRQFRSLKPEHPLYATPEPRRHVGAGFAG